MVVCTLWHLERWVKESCSAELTLLIILVRFQASAVVVVPVWPQSSYFSKIWPDGRHVAKFVTEMMFMQPYFECGPQVTSNGLRGRRPFYTAVLRVNFSASYLWDSDICYQLCLRYGCEECLHVS